MLTIFIGSTATLDPGSEVTPFSCGHAMLMAVTLGVAVTKMVADQLFWQVKVDDVEDVVASGLVSATSIRDDALLCCLSQLSQDYT